MPTLAHCHSLVLRFEDYLAAQWRIVAGTVKGDPERGSVTIEQVIWAVAIIAIAVSYTHLTLPTNREV